MKIISLNIRGLSSPDKMEAHEGNCIGGKCEYNVYSRNEITKHTEGKMI